MSETSERANARSGCGKIRHICLTTYGDIERGDKDLKLSRLQDIAEALDIKASELLDFNDKAVLNVCLNRKSKNDNKITVYFGADAEIEKLQMQLDMKDRKIAYCRRGFREKFSL